MRRSDQTVPAARPRPRLRLLPRGAALPLPVSREFLDMLFGMRLPIVGMGVVFVAIASLAAYEWSDPVFATIAALGALVTVARTLTLNAFARRHRGMDLPRLERWERYYAIGCYGFALLLALLNMRAISYHYPLLHLVTVSLVFSFGAGVVSRISVRPAICVVSLLLATAPTVGALTWHALTPHDTPLHGELFAAEAFLVAMITGLSLQTVGYLYRSAVQHHTAKHDMSALARHDALTGLANRLLLRERFDASMASAGEAGSLLAVHCLDLDGFKAVNDIHGHPAGDAVLRMVAERLAATVRAEDTVARLGGDEFVVLQTNVAHASEADMLARRIIKKLSAPYEVEGATMHLSASIGIALAPELGRELEALTACADSALYRSKTNGKARASLCGAEEAAQVQRAVA